MRRAALILPVFVLVAAGAGCGDANGPGFYISGSIAATITDPSTSTPTDTRFEFDQQTRIDTTVPEGGTSPYTGTCTVGPNGRSLHIIQTSPQDLGLREVMVTMPSWDQDSCTNCVHGTITATTGNNSGGTTAWTGSEQRGTGVASQCTFTSTRNGSYGMQLMISCSGLTATGDARTVGISTNVTLEGCDGPNSNGG